MPEPASSHHPGSMEALLAWWGRAAVCAVFAIAIVVWIGWATGIYQLTQIFMYWPPTTPWTAVLLAGAAAAVLLQSGHPSPGRVWAGRGFAVLTCVLAVMFLAEYVTDSSFGVDQMWFSDAVRTLQVSWPGRPSPHSALSVLLLAIAVGLTRVDRRWMPPIWVAGLVAAIALPLVVFAGYVFEALSLVGVTPSTGMGIATAIALVLLVNAAFVARLDRNPLAWLLGRPDRWALVWLISILAGPPILIGLSRQVFLRSGLSEPAAWVLSISVSTVAVGVATFYLSQRAQRLLIEKGLLSRERAEAEDRYRLLFEAAPDALIIVGVDGRIVLANAQTDQIFGYPREELVGSEVEKLLPPRFRSDHLQHRNNYIADPIVRPMGAGLELWGLRRDGTEFPVAISLSPLNVGPTSEVLAAIRDVTEQHEYRHRLLRQGRELIEAQNEQRLLIEKEQLSRQRAAADRERAVAQMHYRLLADNSVDVVLRLRGSEVVWISPSVEAPFGYAPEQWIGTDILGHIHPDDRDIVVTALQGVAHGEAVSARARIATAEGGYHWVEGHGKPYFDDDGNDDGVIAAFRVIDDQIAAERRLERLAKFDAVTGLVNHAETIARFEAALDNHRSHGPHLGVLFCDVDHFKNINDTFGHNAGDAVLATLATRIRECVRDGDTVGRTGGDEILALLPGMHDLSDVTRIAKKVRARVAEPIDHSGKTIHLTLSIGATLAAPGESVSTVTARADAAMYQAKQNGRNTTVAITAPVQ